MRMGTETVMRQTALERYQELLETNRLITSTLDREAILSIVVERAARLLDADASVLLWLDHLRDAGQLRVIAAHNLPIEIVAELRFRLGPAALPSMRELRPETAADALIAVPMLLHEETVGVLAVYC